MKHAIVQHTDIKEFLRLLEEQKSQGYYVMGDLHVNHVKDEIWYTILLAK